MRVRLAATVALLVLLGSGCTHGPDPYATVRQAREEKIPGTFSYVLRPPGDIAPTVGPQHAYDGLPGAGTEPDVTVTFAVVLDTDSGRSWGPAWVFFTRHLCYFSAKGDLVSPGRFGDGDACTDQNMFVQVVDVRSGSLVGAFSAYDTTVGWLPDRGEQPVHLDGTTRFH